MSLSPCCLLSLLAPLVVVARPLSSLPHGELESTLLAKLLHTATRSGSQSLPSPPWVTLAPSKPINPTKQHVKPGILSNSYYLVNESDRHSKDKKKNRIHRPLMGWRRAGWPLPLLTPACTSSLLKSSSAPGCCSTHPSLYHTRPLLCLWSPSVALQSLLQPPIIPIPASPCSPGDQCTFIPKRPVAHPPSCSRSLSRFLSSVSRPVLESSLSPPRPRHPDTQNP